jgi:sodium-dependent dicarboxylate transporter 2/3/5
MTAPHPPQAHPQAHQREPDFGEPLARKGYQRAGLILGLAAFILMSLLPAPEGMPGEAWKVAAVAALMALWWVSEALPVSATALLPLFLFPLMGVAGVREAALHYANPVVFLIFGGFVIAVAMQKWRLHRRIALKVLSFAGTRSDALIAGFMAATAAISMWVSNTATTIMMLPIAVSVIALINRDRAPGSEDEAAEDVRFATALVLAVAFSASIGGLGTLIGTIPNALFAAFMLDNYGVEIGFARWMLVGVPLALVMLVLAWAILTKLIFAVGHGRHGDVEAMIAGDLEDMGPLSRGEQLTASVIACVAAAWIVRPFLSAALPGMEISDTVIAIAGAVALFIIPVDAKRGIFILDREWAAHLSWSVLILFGGGLSLAAGITESGLSQWIGTGMEGLAGLPLVVIVVSLTALIILLTELTSNTATTIVFLPLTVTLAEITGIDPVMLLVPVVTAASCAFMIPVATPPNAIVFASGRITVPQMARAGLLINVAAVPVITACAMTVAAWVFG